MAALPGGTDVAVNHKFISGKADGADPTLVQPSKWNQNENLGQGADGQKVARDSGQTDGASWVNYDTASLTNNTGGAAAVGDVVAVSLAADNTVVLDDTVSSLRRFVVALQTPAGAAVGAYGIYGPIPGVKAQGAIPAGNYIRKSATAKAVEDTGVAVTSATAPPSGALGFATTAAAAGFVNVFWFSQTVGLIATTVVTLDRKNTFTDVVNSVVATAAYSFSVPGGTLGTTKFIRIRAIMDWVQNTAGAQAVPTIAVTYGGTNAIILNTFGSVAANANRYGIRLDCLIGAGNATNVQRSEGIIYFGAVNTASGVMGTSPVVQASGVNNAMAVDSTVAQTLTITITNPVADPQYSTRVLNVIVELL